MNIFRSCVAPDKRFVYGIHKPGYRVSNLRQATQLYHLGHTLEGELVTNEGNFPESAIEINDADWVFEIPNAFPFKGATFIKKSWADARADNLEQICIEPPQTVSMSALLRNQHCPPDMLKKFPEPVLLALATCTTDPDDLSALAEQSCAIEKDVAGQPVGIGYEKTSRGGFRPIIHNMALFEAVANNPALPDAYKIAMVLRPGVQGSSPIVAEWPQDETSHVYEYLRSNSYISGGHYAANMAEDAIRYSIATLTRKDVRALRHLYYQRSYVRLAEELKIPLPADGRMLDAAELETLRQEIVAHQPPATLSATLWGWNFGFDYAPTKYRLHASHQQIHQQYAMLPKEIEAYSGSLTRSCGTIPSYGCGDLIADAIKQYRKCHDRDLFTDYRAALATNQRMDGRQDLDASLVVWQDNQAMLFVPKAQTSQWELQLMTLPDDNGSVAGNIVEADEAVRDSLDQGIFMAQKALAGLGAKMVTSIEYPKRIGANGRQAQPLLYSFLPRLPESPGGFSEAQLRFINGHYPEDFAAACRRQLKKEHQE